MELKVIVRNNTDFPPLLEEYLSKKVERLKRYTNQGALSVEAIASEEGPQKVCELLTRLKGKEIFARGKGDDFKKAIDEVHQRFKMQLEKYFKKKIDSKRRIK